MAKSGNSGIKHDKDSQFSQEFEGGAAGEVGGCENPEVDSSVADVSGGQEDGRGGGDAGSFGEARSGDSSRNGDRVDGGGDADWSSSNGSGSRDGDSSTAHASADLPGSAGVGGVEFGSDAASSGVPVLPPDAAADRSDSRRNNNRLAVPRGSSNADADTVLPPIRPGNNTASPMVNCSGGQTNSPVGYGSSSADRDHSSEDADPRSIDSRGTGAHSVLDDRSDNNSADLITRSIGESSATDWESRYKRLLIANEEHVPVELLPDSRNESVLRDYARRLRMFAEESHTGGHVDRVQQAASTPPYRSANDMANNLFKLLRSG